MHAGQSAAGRILLQLVMLLTIISSAGCAMSLEYGEPVKVKALSNLTPGTSSTAEVRAVLGEPRGYGVARFTPEMVTNDIWYYEYTKADMKKTNIQILLVYFYENTYEGHMWFSAAELMERTEAPPVSKATPGVSDDFESTASFVLVDQSESAFTVFAGIAKDTNERELEEIRSKVANQERVSMLTWNEFTASVNKYARSTIVRNDYPNVSVVDGLVCLVGRTPGAPWGLAWNGGIALTFNDYEHVRQSYESYKANPDAYRPMRDPRADPVNPGGHLPAFGCMY